MSVASEQRFSRSYPCPICGGNPTAPRGTGERCYGYRSSDDLYAHCTREEHAGGLDQTAGSSGTYPHRLEGECACGTRHGELAPAMYSSRNDRGRKPPGGPTIGWSIKDVKGEVQAIHVRVENAEGGKEFRWKQPSGEWGLNGRPVADLPLYRSEYVVDWSEDMPVVVVEGERAADALAQVYPAVLGTVTGARGTPGLGALEVLRDRRVLLWPDNDEEGRQHMARIAEALWEG